MMLDDMQPHSTGPAPAYAYESDSEDDEWSHPHDTQPEPRPMSVSTCQPAPPPDFRWSSEPARQPNQPLLVLLGHAGQVIATGLPTAPITATLELSSKPFAYYLSDTSTVCLPSSVSLDLQHPLALFVLKTLKPGPITLISAYPSPTYLPPWPASQTRPPPIRFLLSGPETEAQAPFLNLGMKPFSAPNLIQGLDAALILQAEMIGVRRVTSILLPSVSKTSVMDQVAVRAPASAYDGAPGGGHLTSTPMLLDQHDPYLQEVGEYVSIRMELGWKKNGDGFEDLFEKLDGLGVEEVKKRDAILNLMYI